jgi:hypothetical protein
MPSLKNLAVPRTEIQLRGFRANDFRSIPVLQNRGSHETF